MHTRISPDGARVARRARRAGREDGHLLTSTWPANVTSRLISNAGDDMFPVWSPRRGASSTSPGSGAGQSRPRSAVARSAGASDEILFESTRAEGADFDFTGREGAPVHQERQRLCLAGETSGRCRCRGTGSRYPVVQTRYEEEEAVFSPDGKWISYHSDDLGAWQVYVDAFPPTGRPVRISTTSGYAAAWSADGKTILYKSDGKIMAVDLDVRRPGRAPVALARALRAAGAEQEDARSLDVDGRRGVFCLSRGQQDKRSRLRRSPSLQGWLTRAQRATEGCASGSRAYARS